jgi:DtxR family Mn-dependent transcriptional regulator
MMDHNPGGMSESEEMYLVALARLVEQGVEEPVPISRLAEDLSIQPVSANQMVHKLTEEGLLTYLPYKGVELTTRGRQIARQLLRDRRLWEVFLVRYLKLSASEADALACRLEHITPRKVTGRLAEFLGHPAVTSQGLKIPEENGEAIGEVLHPLAALPVGKKGEIMRIEADATTRAYLETQGFRPGEELHFLAINGQGVMLLQVGQNRIQMAGSMADLIFIRVQEDNTDLL